MGIVIPIDYIIFFRGVDIPPTSKTDILAVPPGSIQVLKFAWTLGSSVYLSRVAFFDEMILEVPRDVALDQNLIALFFTSK